MPVPSLALATLVACAPQPSPPPPAEPPSPARPTGPSVLLVTLDTTRADHLGAYGFPTAETPTFDGLAAAGTLFLRAYSSAPLTIPSHSTILTGRFPPSHGVRDNGDFVLPDEALTLAERFAAAGWSTVAVTSAFPTHRRWGFAQGFDVYHDPLPRSAAVRDWRDQRRADEVVDDALDALARVQGPVFTWVHLFDAHWPYAPPDPYASRHDHPYDGEIAFADHELGRLIAGFRERFPDPVIVVTADHGEGLGDGGEPTHGFLLHDGTLRVPLVLVGPGVPAGQRVDDPVGHPDVAPTVLRLAGLPVDGALQGKDLLSGGSDAIWSEGMTGRYSLGLSALVARTDAAGRFTRGGWDGFYPYEVGRIGVVPVRRDLAPRAAALDALAAALGPATAPQPSLAADELQQLASLGYVGGDPLAASGTIDPRDVIDVVPLTWQVRQALGAGALGPARRMLDRLRERMPGTVGVRELEAAVLQAEGRPEEAVSVLVALDAEAPSASHERQIGDLELALGDPWSAERWYTAALEHLGNDPGPMAGLVRCALAEDDPERARELAERFLGVHPDHAELHLVLAETLLLDGRPREALREASAGLDDLPWSPWALSLDARAHWALGEPDVAIDRLKDALDLTPVDVGLRAELAAWLLDVGRRAEAVRTIRPVARLLPDDADVQALAREAEDALAAERRR